MVILDECYLIVCCVMWLSTLPMYVYIVSYMQHMGQVNDTEYNRMHCLSLLYIYIYIYIYIYVCVCACVRACIPR